MAVTARLQNHNERFWPPDGCTVKRRGYQVWQVVWRISFRVYNESKRRDLGDSLCMWTSLICIPVSDTERPLQLWCLLSHEFPTSLPSAFAKNALEYSPISQSTATANSFFIAERSTTQSARGFRTEDGCWEASEAWRKMFFLPDKALQVQRGALFLSSVLCYCSPKRESRVFGSYGLQSLRRSDI